MTHLIDLESAVLFSRTVKYRSNQLAALTKAGIFKKFYPISTTFTIGENHDGIRFANIDAADDCCCSLCSICLTCSGVNLIMVRRTLLHWTVSMPVM